MKKFSEQLKKQAEGLHLKASERTDLRERLLAYMEYHPLREGQSYADTYRTRKSLSVHLDGWLIGRVLGATATLCLIIVPVLAEKALPGDVLYPVKVSFNEEIRSSLVLSPYEKVEWETTLLQRRIAEARLLATEGKLTPEVEAEVADAVRQHSDAAQAGIATIRETDSEEAAIAEITFASALEVQSEVLEGHAERDASTADYGRSVAGLTGAVQEARDDAAATQSGEQASYEKLAARVELETTRAQELFSSINGSASDNEIASIEKRLTGIQAKITKAMELQNTEVEPEDPNIEEVIVEEEVDLSSPTMMMASLAATSSASTTEGVLEEPVEEPMLDPQAEAIILLRQVLADTQKLISFMTDIDVRLNVSIDELVPEEVDTDTTDIATSTEEVLGVATDTEAVEL